MGEKHICDDAGASMPEHERRKLVSGRHRKDDNFRCGSCRATFATICVLHAHCEKHSEGGSYFFDHFTRTAFAKYDTACVVTQTDLDDLPDEASSIGKLSPNNTNVINCGGDQTVNTSCSSSGKNSLLQKARNTVEVRIKKEPKHEAKFVDLIQSRKGSVCKGSQDSEQLADGDVEQSRAREYLDGTERHGDQNPNSESNSTLKTESDQNLKSSSFVIRRSSRQRKRKQFTDCSFTYGDKISNEPKLKQNENGTGCLVKKQILDSIVNTAGDSMQMLAHDDEYKTGVDVDSGNAGSKIITRSGISGNRNVEYTEATEVKPFKMRSSGDGSFLIPDGNPTEDKEYPTNDNSNCGVSASEAMMAINDEYSTKATPNAAVKLSGVKSCNGTNTFVRSKSRNKKSDSKEQTESCNDALDTAILNFDEESQLVQSAKPKKRGKGRDATGQSQQHECPTCGKVGTSGMLTYHKYLHMEKKSFSCDKCGALFQHPQSLQIHLRQHDDKRYKCSECPAAFHRKPYLTTHMLKHKGENPFMCDLCGKSYRDPSHLKRHIKHVHDQVRSFSCDICQEKFFRSDHLSNHRLRHFEPDKKCSHCPRLFKHPNDLLRHMQIHTGEKNWYCNMCGHGFVSVTPYYVHMEKKHNVPKKEAKLLKDKLREEYKKIKQEKAQTDSGQQQDLFEAKSDASVIAENTQGTDTFGNIDEAQTDTSNMFILRDTMEGHDYASGVEIPTSQTDVSIDTDTKHKDFTMEQDDFINYNISTTTANLSPSLTTEQHTNSNHDLMVGDGGHVIHERLSAESFQHATDFSSRAHKTKATSTSRQRFAVQESKIVKKKKGSKDQKFSNTVIQVRNEKGKLVALKSFPLQKQRFVKYEIPHQEQFVGVHSGEIRVVQMKDQNEAELVSASHMVAVPEHLVSTGPQRNEYVIMQAESVLTDLGGAEHEMQEKEENSENIATKKQILEGIHLPEGGMYQLSNGALYTGTLNDKETLIRVVNEHSELEQSGIGNTEMYSELNNCTETMSGEQVIIVDNVNVGNTETLSQVNSCSTQTISTEEQVDIADSVKDVRYDIMEEDGEICEVQYTEVGGAGGEEIVTCASELGNIAVGEESGNIVIGNESGNIMVGNESGNIMVGNESGNIAVGEESVNIVIGNESGNIVVGNESGNIAVGEESGNIVIGNESGNIVVGNESGNIVVGGESGNIVVGNESGNIMVGGESGNIVVGNESGNIVVGNESGNIMVGGESGNIVVGGESGNMVGDESEVGIMVQWNDGSIGGMSDTVMIVDGEQCASEVIIDNL